MADANSDDRLTTGKLIDYLADPTGGVPYCTRSIFNGLNQTPALFGDSTMVMVEYLGEDCDRWPTDKIVVELR